MYVYRKQGDKLMINNAITQDVEKVLMLVPGYRWATVEELASKLSFTVSRCQLILTQLEMAGYLHEQNGEYAQIVNGYAAPE